MQLSGVSCTISFYNSKLSSCHRNIEMVSRCSEYTNEIQNVKIKSMSSLIVLSGNWVVQPLKVTFCYIEVGLKYNIS